MTDRPDDPNLAHGADGLPTSAALFGELGLAPGAQDALLDPGTVPDMERASDGLPTPDALFNAVDASTDTWSAIPEQSGGLDGAPQRYQGDVFGTEAQLIDPSFPDDPVRPPDSPEPRVHLPMLPGPSRVCSVGPCVHFHQVVAEVDATTPGHRVRSAWCLVGLSDTDLAGEIYSCSQHRPISVIRQIARWVPVARLSRFIGRALASIGLGRPEEVEDGDR